MPNGKGFAQCGECGNFIGRDKPHCKKHNFDFPLIIMGYEILCRDYTPVYSYSEKPSTEVENLEEGYLFYYSCQGGRNYRKLESFTEQKGPIYGIHFLEDRRYKWLFEVKNYYKGLWGRKSIILQYGNKKENFVQRALTKEMFVSFTIATKNILYAPQHVNVFVPQDENSELINSFIEDFIGLEEYRCKKRLNEEAFIFGISVFIKKIDDSVFKITPDLIFKDFLEKIISELHY